MAFEFLQPLAEVKKTDFIIPSFTELAAKGEKSFTENCAACHGINAGGTDQGPPLIHDIYNPGHHTDVAFSFAAKNGVRQHHWPFGNMPPQPQVKASELAMIIKYVRELQIANGILFRAHKM